MTDHLNRAEVSQEPTLQDRATKALGVFSIDRDNLTERVVKRLEECAAAYETAHNSTDRDHFYDAALSLAAVLR